MKRNSVSPAVRLAAMLTAAAMLFCGCGSEETEPTAEDSRNITEVAAAAAKNTAAKLPTDTTGAEKAESVYVTADANGTPIKTEVTVTLKHAADGSKISDVSNLTDIRNSGGDEELTQNGSTLVWQNLGEDITYKGSSDQRTPVTVQVSYQLDGKEISPEDLAGKSGRVTIRFDYQNNTARTVSVDGKEYETITPYTVISAVLLPEDTFSNIEVTNGDVMELEDNRAAVGIALPGLADALKLGDFKPTEDVELPEYVEITADCVNFELEFTATVLSSGFFEEIEDDDLKDAEDLCDDMKKLTDAGDELQDGTLQLLNAEDTIRGYYKQYMEGVSKFSSGVAEAYDGISALAEQEKKLAEATAGLDSGLAALNTGIAAADLSGADSLSAAGTKLKTDAEALQTALTSLQTNLTAIVTFTTDAQCYIDTVTAALSNADSELTAADSTLAGINDTAKQQASAAVQQLLDSMGLTEEQLNADQRQALVNAAAAGIDISSDIAAAQGHIANAKSSLSGISALNVPNLTIDLTAVNDAIAALAADAQTLGAAGQALSGLNTAVASLKQSLPVLAQTAAAVNQGTAAISAYLTEAANGKDDIQTAAENLNTYGLSLADGLDQLNDGMLELYNGTKEFNEDGLQKLGKLAGSDLQKLITRIKALREADRTEQAFTGSVDGASVETSYIIETAAIQKSGN